MLGRITLKDVGLVAFIYLLLLLGFAIDGHAQGICPPNPNPAQPQVCLRWSAAPLVNIYRATLPGTENYILPPLNGSTPVPSPYIDTTVKAATSYYYTAVQVVGGDTPSAPSNEAGAQIPVQATQPQNFAVSVQ